MLPAALAVWFFCPAALMAQAAPVLTSALAAGGKVGLFFKYQIAATNGPTRFGASGLPEGLQINTRTGGITGTITGIDRTYNATISATNGSGTASKILAITVAPSLPSFASTPVPTGRAGSGFTHRVVARNHPRTFAATGLPAGLSINATTGVISGKPTGPSKSRVGLSASNGAGTATGFLNLEVLPMPPAITSNATATAKAREPFSYQITASNGPTEFGAVGLPPGLRFNRSTGLITGTTEVVDKTYTVTLTAANSGGTGSKNLSLAVAPAVPAIAGPAAATARTGQPFSYQIAASNFPRSFGASGLPAGLSVNTSSGSISGIPAGPGNASVTLSATNGAGTGNKTLALTVLPPPPVVSGNATAAAKLLEPFAYQITATNNPTSFSASGLPAGLSLDPATGWITGQPTAIDAQYIAMVSATNSGGTGSKNLAIAVAPRLPAITSNSTASGSAGQPFSHKVSASNFPRTFAASGLPAGLSFNAATATVSGIPASPGNHTVVVSAANGAGTATQNLLLTIWHAKPVVSIAAGEGSVLFTAKGGAGGHTWSVSKGLPPEGMSLNPSTGELSGNPTQSGIHTFSVRATDSKGNTGEAELALDIEDPGSGTAPADIFSLFPAGGAPVQAPGNATCSFTYQPSGSAWTAGANEQAAFLASVTTDGLRIGIGKGGQIYSLRGHFGEAIPPQRTAAPWIDEVWQFVATNNDLVTPIHAYQALSGENRAKGFPMQFFIHQAGIYLAGLAGNNATGAASAPFYSPALKSRWIPESRTFQTVSWSQMARSPNVWKSGVLTYTSYRDLGAGMVEATNVVTNFGDVELTFLNTPWGGTRHSSLPKIAVSKAAGGWQEASVPFPSTALGAPNTAGWMAWSQNPHSDTGLSLALVFGNDAGPLPAWKMRRAAIRYGAAGDLANRNYNVAEVSNLVRLPKGRTLACRWHLAAGHFKSTAARAQNLAPFAGTWVPETDPSKATPVWIGGGGPSGTGTGEPQLWLYAHPVPGTVPVFSMEDTRTNRVFATLDPYELCRTAPFQNPLPPSHPEFQTYQNRTLYYQYESPGKLRELLGYAYPAQPPFANDSAVELPAPSGTLTVWAPQLPPE